MRTGLLLTVCVLTAGVAQAEILFSQENPKYGLTCLVHGEQERFEHGATLLTVKRITLKTSQGAEVAFVPLDLASLSPWNTDASLWSPDGEWLVLPLGKFEGFALVKASEALKRLPKKNYNDTVRIQMDTGAQLAHTFEGWKGNFQFAFRAGLSGDASPFIYAISNQLITSAERLSPSFLGVTTSGKRRIQPAQ